MLFGTTVFVSIFRSWRGAISHLSLRESTITMRSFLYSLLTLTLLILLLFLCKYLPTAAGAMSSSSWHATGASSDAALRSDRCRMSRNRNISAGALSAPYSVYSFVTFKKICRFILRFIIINVLFFQQNKCSLPLSILPVSCAAACCLHR
jgi:hypothetical protein